MTLQVAFLYQIIFGIFMYLYLFIHGKMINKTVMEIMHLNNLSNYLSKEFIIIFYIMLIFFWFFVGTYYRFYTGLPLLGWWGYII